MKILNLADLDKSEIKYKISKFPDGQQQIIITHEENYYPGTSRTEGYTEKIELRFIERKNGAIIKSRLNNFKDLELIICSVASLKELGFKRINLYVPYIMGARSDRKFEEGSNNYLKDVICPILNSLELESITCLDPHSDCLEMGIKNFKKVSNLELVDFAIKSIYNTFYVKNEDAQVYNNFILLSPDAGASKKIYKVAEKIGYRGSIITCSKDRDTNGKLTKTIVPWLLEEATKDLIIIDDICDGGKTFINMMKVSRDEGYIGKAYLVVTHGIFSKGLKELSDYFDGVYSTNSYREIDMLDNDYVFNLTGPFLKQLDVF